MSIQADQKTFLLTDVEGSTSLWESHRDAMARALARHDAIATEAAQSQGGEVVKARGEGDSLFIVFDDPAQALSAACLIQRRFVEEPWPPEAQIRVRMAIHVGDAVVRAEDYYGPAVNRCARLRSIGHGGQILLTDAACRAIGDRLPPGVRLRDLGVHALRDISGGERVHQVECAALRCEFPPLLSPDLTPTNLPYRRNPALVGRAAFVEELHAALQSEPRLPVALVGITGIGKTQIAVEYAHQRLGDYPCGVFWVSAGGADRLVEEMAALGRFLDVPEAGSPRDRALRVREALQRLPEPALLILDNVTEDVDLSIAPAVGRCRVLLTTVHRHVARHACRLLAPQPLDEVSALALLRGVRDAFRADEEAAAREIADRLGRLPLALALVANHVDRLNLSFREYGRQLAAAPLDVLARARKRFTSDTGHSGSIYDAVGITYRGLDDDARSVLKTAACFAGRGIRPLLLRRASSLASEAAFDEALADLTDRFLVEREEEGRLSVHELVREFVSAQMSDAEAREVVTRVADTLAELMQEADESGDWSTARAETPHAVVAAGICRARCAGEPLRALSMQLGEYGMQHGDPGGAAERFGEALETARRLYGERSLEAAAALRELSWAYAETGREQDARDAAERAIGIARDLLDPRDAELAEYENSLGYALRVMGDLDRALPHYQRALAIAGQAGGRRNRRFARYLNNIGAVLEAQGDLEAALDHMREALRIDESRRGAASSTLAIRQNNIGRVLGKLGQWEEALERHERAVALHEAAYGRKHPDVAASLFFAGRACRMLGRRSDALRLLSEAQQTYALFGDPARTLGRMIDDERSALLTEDENAS